MKRIPLSLLCASLLTFSACSSNDSKTTTSDTTTNSEEAGGNAGDNYMNAATNGDTAATSMPADSTQSGSAAANRTAPADMNGSPGPGDTAPHSTDQEFMQSAAASDQNEIQLSKLALEKGVTGVVKDHANMMIKDHTKSTTDLKAIAGKKNVTLPADMDGEHKAIAASMRKLSGKDFETKFMDQMVMDHQKTLNTLKAHQQMTKDADLQGFIGKVTPVVQGHLDMSKKHSDMKM
jgi:putative membrane protein